MNKHSPENKIFATVLYPCTCDSLSMQVVDQLPFMCTFVPGSQCSATASAVSCLLVFDQLELFLVICIAMDAAGDSGLTACRYKACMPLLLPFDAWIHHCLQMDYQPGSERCL